MSLDGFLESLPEDTDDTKIVVLTLPSDIEYVPVLEALAGKLARTLKFDEDSVELVGVALIEGAMNAIKHGNKYDLTKRVYVTTTVDPVQMTIKIKDEGDGFIPDEVANPFDGDNLFRDHGRGILMMRAYMDDVSYNEDGTELTIVKKRPE